METLGTFTKAKTHMKWCGISFGSALLSTKKLDLQRNKIFFEICILCFLYTYTEFTKDSQTLQDIRSGGLENPGRGTLIFSAYVGSDPASTPFTPKKYQKFQAPKKIFEIFATPKNIPILYIYLKKRP